MNTDLRVLIRRRDKKKLMGGEGAEVREEDTESLK